MTVKNADSISVLPSKASVPWRLDEMPAPSKLTAFSTFHCGGGSSMGYKLAGFNVLGGVEIDPKMSQIYYANLKPQLRYMMSVTEFEKMSSLPKELFKLDLLDGSPPCSTFSHAGEGKKNWGKEKHFKEGQAAQVLDTLPMCWARIVVKLKPKVAVMENVPGMINGDAKGYVLEVMAHLEANGYSAQLFILDASKMGVAQKRPRIFIVARRTSLRLKPLALHFNEKPIPCSSVVEDCEKNGRTLTPDSRRLWDQTRPGDSYEDAHLKGSRFNEVRLDGRKPAATQSATLRRMHWSEPRYLSDQEVSRIQSFPDDYDFGDEDPGYVCGMSVPPLMIQRLALEIRRQWLG